jgi:hypothetical protein
MMTENGKAIRDYLDTLQKETSVGCGIYDHRYSHNGTLSCIKCGKIKSN